MSHNHSSIRSKDVSIDVLVDFTKKLYSSDKTRKLDNVTDNKEKIYILHEIVSGKIENKRIE